MNFLRSRSLTASIKHSSLLAVLRKQTSAVAVNKKSFGFARRQQQCLPAVSARFSSFSTPSLSAHKPEIVVASEYDMTASELFRQAAQRYPDLVALEGPIKKYTYAELDALTDSLAAFLRIQYRAAPESIVGIYMERCEEYVIALLSIWKSGAAYNPIELAYPGPLLNSVIEETQPKVILTKSRFLDNLPASAKTFSMDGDWRAAVEQTSPNLSVLKENPGTLDSLGYVVYSGGSTGKPKGIEAPLRSPVASYLWRYSISGYQPGARVGCNVFFVWEVIRPLFRGATTVVIPDSVIFDTMKLVPYLESKGVTEVLFTPSLFETLLHSAGADALSSLPLEVVWLNGEVVTTKLVQTAWSLLPNVTLYNTYSISECGEVCSGKLSDFREDCPKFCPVGTLASFATKRLVDTETGLDVPSGQAGELWVAGRGVGRGYSNNPKKTAETFVTYQGVPYYRTGDLARELHDGFIEILGRCDFMVKVRGYSIALGSVEAAILKLFGVSQCCVVAKGEEGTDKRLAAYICPCASSSLHGRMPLDLVDIDEYGRSPKLFQELLKELPHYAVPSVFIKLDKLPLNKASNKTDRFALPALPSLPPAAELPDDFTFSATESGAQLLFEEVLALPVGTLTPESNFFEFGGHSLLVTKLLAKISALGGPKIAVEDFLRTPTVQGLVSIARGDTNHPETVRYLPHEVDKHSQYLQGLSIGQRAFLRNAIFAKSCQRVLLTGATGYVGAHILHKLITETHCQVFCLVRAPKDSMLPTSARQRLLEHLKEHGLNAADVHEDRLQVILGDVSLPHLGLDTEDYLVMQQMIDVVVHAAANVNLAYNYDLLEASNVEGTLHALSFAIGGKLKPFHYVSTNGMFPETGDVSKFIESDVPPAHLLHTGYAQTKWVAERLVAKAAQIGLPTVVYRLGNVGGPLMGTGWNPKDSNLLFLRACAESGSIPGESWSIELTPVDFISSFIVKSMMDLQFVHGKTFHLINEKKVPLDIVRQVLSHSGFHMKQLPAPLWCEKQREQGDHVSSLVLGREALESLLGRHHSYSNRNVQAACNHFSLSYPELAVEDMSILVRQLIQMQLLPSPPTVG